MGRPLILASGSPQRRAILEGLGVAFSVVVSDAVELESGPPEEVVLENAHRKATAVAAGFGLGSDAPGDGGRRAGGQLMPNARPGVHNASIDPGREGQRAEVTVLGVDTVVALGATVYGKPRDAAHARATLELLSGRTHRVLSGVCVIDRVGDHDRVRTAAAVTSVTFRRLDIATLSWYLATGEWEGRAGGYAIQGRGAALVAGIDGDYLNVVGLPVPTLLELLPDLLH